MESIIFIGIAASCSILITIAINDYIGYQKGERLKSSWKELAQAYNLSFIPGQWLIFESIGAALRGEYRKHRVSLETFQDKGIVHTRISVLSHSSPPENIPLSQFYLGRQLSAEEVMRILIPNQRYKIKKAVIKVTDKGRNLCYEQSGGESNQNLHHILELLIELTSTYPKVVALGADVVTALQDLAQDQGNFLQLVAQQLLFDIEEDTSKRLKWCIYDQFCPQCLTHCTEYEVRISLLRVINYYGCRTCRQSREFLKGSLIAILDSQMKTDLVQECDEIRVNWLSRRELFDFSQVEIIQATDEDVERFAVQVGNDTDAWRRPHYGQMPCIVSAQCHLSENTLRVLERMFGEVTIR
jgi:hypothetical protein